MRDHAGITLTSSVHVVVGRLAWDEPVELPDATVVDPLPVGEADARDDAERVYREALLELRAAS